MIAGVLPSESKHRADALRSIALATLTMRASKQYRFHASTGSTLAISVAIRALPRRGATLRPKSTTAHLASR